MHQPTHFQHLVHTLSQSQIHLSFPSIEPIYPINSSGSIDKLNPCALLPTWNECLAKCLNASTLFQSQLTSLSHALDSFAEHYSTLLKRMLQYSLCTNLFLGQWLPVTISVTWPSVIKNTGFAPAPYSIEIWLWSHPCCTMSFMSSIGLHAITIYNGHIAIIVQVP